MISLLVAMDNNNVIGCNNDLPWRLPRDLKFFKEKTMGKNIIMGSRTYDSIGKPLSNRINTVMTRDCVGYPDEVQLIHDLHTLLKWNEKEPGEELIVIGGGNLFKQVLPHADKMYITLIDEAFDGDTYFPEFDESEWKLVKDEKGIKDEKNPYDYYFREYDRK